MNDCIFCKIIAGSFLQQVYEDDEVVAFKGHPPHGAGPHTGDPQSPYRDMNELTADNTAVVAHISP